MAVPMKNGGMKVAKVIFYVLLSGVTTGIGAFFGALIGTISEQIIAICLSFAAGAMLYIVSGELVPEANQLYQGRMTAMRKHNRISYWDFSNWCLEGRCLKSPFWGLRDTPFKNRCLLTLGIIHNQGIFKI